MKGITSVYIPLDLRKRVDEICKKTHKSMAVIIREALQEYIERFEEKEKIKKYIYDREMKEVLKKLIKDIAKDSEEG